MGQKIIVKKEIDVQIAKMNELSQRFDASSGSIRASLASVADSFRRSGGKSVIVVSCANTTSAVNSVSDSLREGARLLGISRDSYRNLDSVLRAEFSNAEYPMLGNLSFGEATTDQKVFDSMEAYWNSMVGTQYVDYNDDPKGLYRARINENSWNGWTARDKMQCVGYAWARFEYLTGQSPNFSCGYAKYIGTTYNRNILELVNSIDHVKIPALAYHSRGSAGHVVCIENIITRDDGKHVVYYTSANDYSNALDGTLSSYIFEDNPGEFEGFVQLK